MGPLPPRQTTTPRAAPARPTSTPRAAPADRPTRTAQAAKWLDDPVFYQSVVSRIPLGRVASTTEVAESIRWLAVDAPASATGTVIDVNGASYVR